MVSLWASACLITIVVQLNEDRINNGIFSRECRIVDNWQLLRLILSSERRICAALLNNLEYLGVPCVCESACLFLMHVCLDAFEADQVLFSTVNVNVTVLTSPTRDDHDLVGFIDWFLFFLRICVATHPMFP